MKTNLVDCNLKPQGCKVKILIISLMYKGRFSKTLSIIIHTQWLCIGSVLCYNNALLHGIVDYVLWPPVLSGTWITVLDYANQIFKSLCVVVIIEDHYLVSFSTSATALLRSIRIYIQLCGEILGVKHWWMG